MANQATPGKRPRGAAKEGPQVNLKHTFEKPSLKDRTEISIANGTTKRRLRLHGLLCFPGKGDI